MTGAMVVTDYIGEVYVATIKWITVALLGNSFLDVYSTLFNKIDDFSDTEGFLTQSIGS